MNNLFILHTQYNLINGIALIRQEFEEDDNFLLLNAEFDVTGEIEAQLEDNFQQIIYAQRSFFSGTGFAKEKNIDRKIKVFSDSILPDIVFDNVIMCQEEYFDTLIVTRVKKTNNFKLIYLEEDIYFSRKKDVCDTLTHVPLKTRIIKKIQASVRMIKNGRNEYYEPVYFYGMNSHYDMYYVNYPLLVRKEIRNKSAGIEEITKQNLLFGINSLYPEDFQINRSFLRYFVFFLDLVDRYPDLDAVELMIKQILGHIKKDDCVFVKYHPRENKHILALSGDSVRNLVELPKNIPAEKIIACMSDLRVCLIGNTSNAIQIAPKLGIKTISLAKVCNDQNLVMMQCLEDMGVCVIDNNETLEHILDSI